MPRNLQIIDLTPLPAAGSNAVLQNTSGVLWEVVAVEMEVQTAANREIRLVFDDGNTNNTFLSIQAPIVHPAGTAIYSYYARYGGDISGSAGAQRVLAPLPLVYLGPNYRVRTAGIVAGDAVTRLFIVVVEPCPCWRPWYWWWWWPWRWPFWRGIFSTRARG